MKTNKLIKIISSSVLAAACFMVAQSTFAGVVVVVNPSSSLSSATADDIKKVYLAKKKSIGGQAMKPIDNAAGDMRNKFLESVVGKNDRAFKSYWTRMVFSGKAAPLKSGGDDAGVKKYVNENTDGIGFIDSANVDGTVKAVLTID